MTHMAVGEWGGGASYLCHVICVIMTYCLWKSICDSPLRWNPKIQLYRNIIFETDFCLNESLITLEYKRLFSVFFLSFLNKISLPGLFLYFAKRNVRYIKKIHIFKLDACEILIPLISIWSDRKLQSRKKQRSAISLKAIQRHIQNPVKHLRRSFCENI